MPQEIELQLVEIEVEKTNEQKIKELIDKANVILEKIQERKKKVKP